MEQIAKIRLGAEYRNTAGVIIPVGEYDITDPALHGLGHDLVRRREASVTARMVVPEADEPEVVSETPDDYVARFDGWTFDELKTEAALNSVNVTGLRSKAAVIDALFAANVQALEPEPDDDDDDDEPEA